MFNPVRQPAHISSGIARLALVLFSAVIGACSHGNNEQSPTATAAQPTTAEPPTAEASSAASCVASGDGYFRAHLAGAIDAQINWPNEGTRCEGESKADPAGVRLSFHRTAGGTPDLLFVFGVTGVQAGQPARAAGANLTLIVQGTSHIYGTLGDSRCTVDSLSQRALNAPHTFRIEARGFCTQPAHAVRGDGDVLMSTFEFAGQVNFGSPETVQPAALPSGTVTTQPAAPRGVIVRTSTAP